MREDGQAVDDALYSVAMGPDTRVRHYESCVVGDVRYNTLHETKAGRHKTVPS